MEAKIIAPLLGALWALVALMLGALVTQDIRQDADIADLRRRIDVHEESHRELETRLEYRANIWGGIGVQPGRGPR